MGATYARRGKRSWQITVHSGGIRERRTIHGSEKDAKELVQYVNRQRNRPGSTLSRHSRPQQAGDKLLLAPLRPATLHRCDGVAVLHLTPNPPGSGVPARGAHPLPFGACIMSMYSIALAPFQAR